MINILLLMKSMLSVGEDLNKSCRSVMIQLLLLIICPMVQSYAIFRDCENLPALRYCPHVHSSTWEERADCKKCPNGTEYHCCKDYDSPKSPPDCPQDDYYCVTEKFVEGCAKVKFCSKGEEPVLSFIENQQETNKPTVYCVPCHNVNRYNDHSNISSAEFSECFEKQNICTPERNKIECNQSDSTDERYCRCDARNGYSPFNYANDHPSSGCSFENYECKKTIVCPNAQEVLLNYTCGDLCKEGFYRSKDSDVCIPVPTTSSTLMKKEVTKLRNVTTTSLQNSAATVTLADRSLTSTKITSTLATSVDGSGKTTIVGISVGGCVLIIAIIIGYCVWKKRNKKKFFESCTNQGENAGGSKTSGEGGLEEHRLLLFDDFKCNRECVEYCLDKSRPFMVDHLEPKGVLDSLKEKFDISEYGDIRDQYKNSEKIRSLLDTIIRKGPEVYYLFRIALKKRKQMACLNELLKHEKEYSQKKKNSVEDDSESEL